MATKTLFPQTKVNVRSNLFSGWLDQYRTIGYYLHFDVMDMWSGDPRPLVSVRDSRRATEEAFRKYQRLNPQAAYGHISPSEQCTVELEQAFNQPALLEITEGSSYTITVTLRDIKKSERVGRNAPMFGFSNITGDRSPYGYRGINTIWYTILENKPLWQWSDYLLDHPQINQIDIKWFHITDTNNRVVYLEQDSKTSKKGVGYVKESVGWRIQI